MDENEFEGHRNQEDLIQFAEETIGREEPEDYRIKPTSFPERFKSSSPKLARVLGHSWLTEAARRYEAQDVNAMSARESFGRLSSRITWGIFAATAAGAGLASLTVVLPDDPNVIWRLGIALLGVCSVFAGCVATMALYQVTSERLLERWMRARAGAESERLRYFSRVAEHVAGNHAHDPQLLMLGLELIRRYQLAVQQRYYTCRAKDHRARRRKTVAIGAAAAAVVSLGSGGLGISASFIPVVLPLAALGTIGAALANVASRREELSQDERNAERYERTSETLSHIREFHRDVQQAVAEGKHEILLQYTRAVHDQLSLEHRQWLSQREAVLSAVGALSASLKAIEKGTGEAAGNGETS